MDSDAERRAGRPASTSREEIERVAFALFEELGYEQTSMARISDELGIGRRTIFRHVASKHDIAWGAFDRELPRLAAFLADTPREMPLREAVMEAVVRANEEAVRIGPDHALRMRLILREPSLQSHSAQRYVQWRQVIESFVAERAECRPDDPLPRLVAFATNAVAIAAYTQWLRDPDRPLREAFEVAQTLLLEYLA